MSKKIVHEGKYVKFIEQAPDSKLQYGVLNHEGEWLGKIEKTRVGQWQHWCFYPDDETYYTNGCLREIVKFIAGLYKKKKAPSTERAK